MFGEKMQTIKEVWLTFPSPSVSNVETHLMKWKEKQTHTNKQKKWQPLSSDVWMWEWLSEKHQFSERWRHECVDREQDLEKKCQNPTDLTEEGTNFPLCILLHDSFHCFSATWQLRLALSAATLVSTSTECFPYFKSTYQKKCNLFEKYIFIVY